MVRIISHHFLGSFQDNQLLERDEVRTILNRRLRQTGKDFDEELIDAIFNNIDKDLNGRISRKDF